MRAALVAVLLVGCAELPDVTRGECGNGVLESGEECDGVAGCGDPSGGNACKLVCADDGSGCPVGDGCGADLRCRAPTEQFAVGAPTAMPSTGATSVDMDGDGAADLMAYDSRGLVTRFGDADATMAAETRVPLPFSNAEPVTPDVDGNGARDLAVPLAATGWALFYNDGARGMVPAAQSAISLDLPGCDILTGGAVRTDGEGGAQMMLSIGGRTLSFLDHDDCGDPPVGDCVIAPAGGTIVDDAIRTANLGYGVAEGVYPGEQMTAALVDAQIVSVWGEDLTAHRPKRLGAWLLNEPITAAGHIAFAEVSGDGCPDLVVDTGATLDVVFSQSSGYGLCKGLALQSNVAATFPLPFGTVLGIGDLNGDGVDEILYAGTGIIVGGPDSSSTVSAYFRDLTGGGWVGFPLFVTTEAPRAAVVLDYNHDGWNDIALVSTGASTVDFYLNYDFQAFNRFPVDVGGEPRVPVVGDFDGDLEEDVVVSVEDPVNPDVLDAAYIIYGDASGRPSSPQLLGSFVSVATPSRVAGGAQVGTDSVLLISNQISGDGTSCERRVAVLVGDTSRQLVSPYVLLYDDGGGVPRPLTPLGMVDLSTTDTPQVLALGDLPAQSAGQNDQLVVALLGFDGYSYTATGAATLVPDSVLPPEYIKSAEWRTGDLDGDGQVEAVGHALDKLGIVHVANGQMTAEMQTLPADLVSTKWFRLVDMDDDGDLDLIGATGAIAVTPALLDPPTHAGSAIWMVANVGGVLDVATAKTLALPSSLYCYDAEIARTQPSGVPQVVGACYDDGAPVLAIGAFDPDSDPTNVSNLRVLPLPGIAETIEVADYTGDGLDDIAVLASSTLTVYAQCSEDAIAQGAFCQSFTPLP